MIVVILALDESIKMHYSFNVQDIEGSDDFFIIYHF
jgi:hypothetical protein